MWNFFLGLFGSLLGVAATAFVGFRIWRLQRLYEDRLRLLKETCKDFAELCRMTANETEDLSDIEDCLLRLQSNVVLVEVLFDEEVASTFRETMETLAGEGVATEQRKALVRLLGAMARKLD